MTAAAALLLCLLAAPFAHAFTFTLSSPPTQCSNLTLTWSGGVAPYEITLLPLLSTASYEPFWVLNPLDTNTSSTSWSQQLLLPEGSNFVIILSDATGFGTGGTSSVYAVSGSSSNDSSCLPTTPTLPTFTFALLTPTSFSQCATLLFQFIRSGAFQPPLSVSAIIPGGNSFLPFPPLPADRLNTTQSWTIDVQQGTVMAFVVGDATGRTTGGSTPFLIVGASNNSSCLGSDSPSSTAYPAAGAISSSTATSSAPSSTSSPSSSGSTSHTGAIVGGVIGGIAGLLLLALLICVRRRSRNSHRRSVSEKPIGLQAYPFAGYNAGEPRT